MKLLYSLLAASLIGGSFFCYAAQSTPGLPALPPIAPLPTKEKPSAPSSDYKPHKPVEKRQIQGVPSYFHPGVLINKNGSWSGGDYLLNISSNIGVQVTIIQPENSKLDISEQEIRKKIETDFIKAGITPNVLIEDGAPPTPFFQIQVLVYPSGNVIAAASKGALFENVNLNRVILEQGTAFQAITWQRESLIVASPQDFKVNLEKSIDETTSAFIERYQFYRQFQLK